jgi:hypothetical protein
MIHIPVVLDYDYDKLVGVGTLSDSSVEMVISVKHQELLNTIRKLSEEGGFRGVSLSVIWAEAKPVESNDTISFTIRGHIAMCSECYRCFDMLENDSSSLQSHGVGHGASGTITTVLP